jgi:hypothetical protein
MQSISLRVGYLIAPGECRERSARVYVRSSGSYAAAVMCMSESDQSDLTACVKTSPEGIHQRIKSAQVFIMVPLPLGAWRRLRFHGWVPSGAEPVTLVIVIIVRCRV